jgi:hypothetical protein
MTYPEWPRITRASAIAARYTGSGSTAGGGRRQDRRKEAKRLMGTRPWGKGSRMNMEGRCESYGSSVGEWLA